MGRRTGKSWLVVNHLIGDVVNRHRLDLDRQWRLEHFGNNFLFAFVGNLAKTVLAAVTGSFCIIE